MFKQSLLSLAAIIAFTQTIFTTVTKISSSEFESKVLKSEKPVIVDFFATWCTPCKKMAPIFEASSKKFEDKVVFVKVDIDESNDLMNKYSVTTIPTFISFKNGKQFNRTNNSMSKSELTILAENITK